MAYVSLVRERGMKKCLILHNAGPHVIRNFVQQLEIQDSTFIRKIARPQTSMEYVCSRESKTYSWVYGSLGPKIRIVKAQETNQGCNDIRKVFLEAFR